VELVPFPVIFPPRMFISGKSDAQRDAGLRIKFEPVDAY
jgi:hypothetical protein